MNSLLTLLVMATLLAVPAHAGQNDWPWWRGPDRNGHANPNQKLPAGLNAEQDTLWVTTIPGKGHGSPIVVGERLYLVTAEGKAQTQSLLCLDRKTGKPVWSKVVHKGSFPKKINPSSNARTRERGYLVGLFVPKQPRATKVNSTVRWDNEPYHLPPCRTSQSRWNVASRRVYLPPLALPNPEFQ